jgi:multiple sugar transport system substrate-binding protein
MEKKKQLSRREFLKIVGLTAAGTTLAACAPQETPAPAITPEDVPAVISPRTVRIAVGGWAEQNMRDLLEVTDFSRQTGIDVEIIIRADTKETELTRLTGAVQANTSPYDVIDFEDELTTTFSQSDYVIGLDDLLPSGFWDDFPPEMIEYNNVWGTYRGETFRIEHNWEMPYWWYRKDWFDERGVAIPTTWDEVAALGEVFTDPGTGVYATADGLIKGAFLNVYLAWVTLQAGGNPFDVGPEYRQALQYLYDLIHTYNAMNPASLEWDYDPVNASYMADRVAFMRQWPFFGNVARGNEEWFEEDKVAIELPPVGPAGRKGSTYAAAWGFGIIRTSPNLDEAKELFKFLISEEAAVEAVKVGFWFLSARKSVLAAAPQDSWLVQALKKYTEAGVLGVRPHHPQFVEALTIIEDTAAAYLTNQMSIDDSMDQARSQLAQLG